MSVERQHIEAAILEQRDVVHAQEREMDMAKTEALAREAEQLFIKLRHALYKQAHKRQSPESESKSKEHFAASIELQKKKQVIMRDLRRTLEALRQDPTSAVDTSVSGRPVSTDADGALWATYGKKRERISATDIIMDGEWGISYNLDGSVPLAVRKRYVFERAKNELRTLFNKQLKEVGLHGDGTGNRNLLHSFVERFSGAHEELRQDEVGIVAENIVRGFFMRLSLALPIVQRPFHVFHSDEIGEQLEKIDFIIEKPTARHRRGARVESDGTISALGVQFTISTKTAKKQEGIEQAKQRGIKRVDDVVLLKFPGVWAQESFRTWMRKGKPAGGPEQFLTLDEKQDLFKGALARMLTDEEMKEGLALLATTEHK